MRRTSRNRSRRSPAFSPVAFPDTCAASETSTYFPPARILGNLYRFNIQICIPQRNTHTDYNERGGVLHQNKEASMFNWAPHLCRKLTTGW